jgi:hypothetical protein
LPAPFPPPRAGEDKEGEMVFRAIFPLY